MSESICIVFCVERGYLERQAIGLAESIARFGRGQTPLELRAYSPRPDHWPAPETIRHLISLGVEWINEPLNTEFRHYPIANKILATAHAEQTSTAEIVCFLDSDKYVLSPIEAMLLPTDSTIGLRPVNRKGPGSSGKDDPNDAYWQALIRDYGIDPEARVQTVVDNESIRPYFNAGFVIFRRAARHGLEWLSLFKQLHAERRIPGTNERCMDQIALAVLVGASMKSVAILPSGVNFPLPFAMMLQRNEAFVWPVTLVSIHYFKFRNSPDFEKWSEIARIPAAMLEF